MANSTLPAASPSILDARPLDNFHPSLWGDSYLSYSSDETTLSSWKKRAEILRREVQEILTTDSISPNCTTKLNLIDAVQRLGVAYHFQEEIEQELASVFALYEFQTRNRVDNGDDLTAVALRFRLLRENGYSVTCDAFRKFMDSNGSLKESLREDVNGILSLYEAAHLRVHGEVILDHALTFSTTILKSMLPHLSPSYTKQVLHALNHPIRKWLPRLDLVHYFSVYEELDNKSLLEFAKLDFNILQKLHQEELSVLSKWWKDLDFATKLPFARDRLVEGYFWVLGVYFEPKYAFARKSLTQMFAMTSIIDDTYDAYGTKEELELFTQAIISWDESAMVYLPEYMKLIYRALLDVYSHMEKEMTEQGKPIYGVQHTKEAMKGLAQAYYDEIKWLNIEEFPTVEEYMEVALVTSGYRYLTIGSFVGMGDVANEEAFEWILKSPMISEASAVICRLVDDIRSHEFERERGHPPSAVECYTREHGVSENESCDALKVEVEKAWKDINEGFMRPLPVAREVLMRILNLCRVIEVIYNESDGYTHVNGTIKDYIIYVLRTPVEV